jgi:hypothetical protein
MPTGSFRRGATRTFVWSLLVGLALACADKGKEQYDQAYERYQALVTQGKKPTDPGFDEVLKALEAVPRSSAASGKARSLHEAIVRSRQRLAPRPLATEPGPVGNPDRDARVIGKEQECVKRVEELGAAKPEEREAAQGRLVACKRELEELKDALFKEGEPH